MLFTTATFICLFLPIVLAGFFGIARFNHAAAALWLFVASVFFYGYWMPEFTLLLLASIAGNFLMGGKISSLADAEDAIRRTKSKRWLIFGIAVNLALLSYPPRHNTCRFYRTKNLGAAMKDCSGTIRKNIQGPSGSAVIAA